MNQTVLSLTAGGPALAQILGYDARAVVIDNYTSSYVTLTDVGKTIPPFIYGAVVALPSGLRRATAALTATVPAVTGPPVPVSECRLTWTDQDLPESSGHLLAQTSLTSLASIVTSISGLASGGVVTLVNSIPGRKIFVHGLSVVVTRAGGGLGFSHFVIRSSSSPDFGAANFLAGIGDAAGTRFQYEHDAGGSQCVAGDDLIIKNTDTATHDYMVTVGYSQAA